MSFRYIANALSDFQQFLFFGRIFNLQGIIKLFDAHATLGLMLKPVHQPENVDFMQILPHVSAAEVSHFI
jgi:hypothetical protein